jgi:hypothetical protein
VRHVGFRGFHPTLDRRYDQHGYSSALALLAVLAYNYAINLRAINPIFLFQSMPSTNPTFPVLRKLAASRSLLARKGRVGVLDAIEKAARALRFAGCYLGVLVSAALSAQAADVAGWRDLPWGSGKAAVLKALKSLHVREASADELVIEEFRDEFRGEFRRNGMPYRVALFFLPKYGLAKVTMTSEADRDSFQKALSDLTSRYGKPELRAEYDGDREMTLTVFQWLTPHGRLSLSSDYGEGASGLFTVVYESAVNRQARARGAPDSMGSSRAPPLSQPNFPEAVLVRVGDRASDPGRSSLGAILARAARGRARVRRRHGARSFARRGSKNRAHARLHQRVARKRRRSRGWRRHPRDG